MVESEGKEGGKMPRSRVANRIREIKMARKIKGKTNQQTTTTKITNKNLQTRRKLRAAEEVLADKVRAYPGYLFQLSRQDILQKISGVIAEIFTSGLV